MARYHGNMKVRPLRAIAAVLASALTVAAQSGRSMSLPSLPVIGANLTIVTNYPPMAAGNLWTIGLSSPFAASQPLSIPGFSVVGLSRINSSTFLTTGLGVYGTGGSASYSFAIPNDPVFVGLALDGQTIDFDTAASTLYLADNDVQILVACGIGNVHITEATISTPIGCDNHVKSIGNGNLGAPTSQGLPVYAYAITRHRGVEGFVEGHDGLANNAANLGDVEVFGGSRPARRVANGLYQTLSSPSGHDISIIRDVANPRQFSVLSYERATGIARIVPGTTIVDTSTATPSPTVQAIAPNPAISRDGLWCAIITTDNTGTSSFGHERVLAFRTDGLSPAIDLSPLPTTDWFETVLVFTDDFLFAAGSNGLQWTSATNPTTLQSVALPRLAASNSGPDVLISQSWRVSRDGSSLYLLLGNYGSMSSLPQEMDVVRYTNNGGVPIGNNHSAFSVATRIGEFGLSSIWSGGLYSPNGIKASVSPDGTRIAFVGGAATFGSASGLHIADGTPNPPLRTVPGASAYSEVAFLSDTTVAFLAGPTDDATSLYLLDVPTGTIRQIGTANDIYSGGSLWSANRDYWYMLRSNTALTRHDILGIDCATGTPFDVTGNEFGGIGVASLRRGSFDATSVPLLTVQMQARRAPVGPYVYFAARQATPPPGVWQDANVFRWDCENGGSAVRLTNNVTTGTTFSSVNTIDSLVVSQDGNHVAWAQRNNFSPTGSEDVFHLDLGTNTVTKVSTSRAGQSITDGSIRFTCDSQGAPTGLVWSRGTGPLSVPTANTVVEWTALGSAAAAVISAPAAGTRHYQVIGTR